MRWHLLVINQSLNDIVISARHTGGSPAGDERGGRVRLHRHALQAPQPEEWLETSSAMICNHKVTIIIVTSYYYYIVAVIIIIIIIIIVVVTTMLKCSLLTNCT